MTVIELGEATWSEQQTQGSSSPRERRLLAMAVLAVLCLSALVASDRPAPTVVRPLWSAPSSTDRGTLLTPDTAFIQEVAPNGTRLTAYELATGEKRWSREVAGSIGFLYPADQAGLLLAPTDRQIAVLRPGAPEPFAPEFHRDTVALDLRTGTTRWHAPGEPQVVYGNTAMMAEYSGAGALRRLRVIRLSDGHTLWSLDKPDIDAQTLAMTGDRPTALLTIAKDGTTTTYRYADGLRTGRARIPWKPAKREQGYYNEVFVVGGNMVVNQANPNGFELRSYRLDTMTSTWGTSGESGYAVPCGTVVCINTGTMLEAWNPEGPGGWTLPISTSVWAVSDDRIVLDDHDGTHARPALIDAATGKMIGEPPLGYLVWTTPPTDSVLLLRATGSPPNRTAIIRWDLRTGRHYVLGMIDRSAGVDCQSVPKYLVCRRGADRVEVTAVR